MLIDKDGQCPYCGRDFAGDEDMAKLIGKECPSEDCPENVEMKGLIYES